MIPVLYEKDAHLFTFHGLGSLPEWLDINVDEERNGEFFLEGSLPVGAYNVENLAIDRIILAAPAPGKRMQPFRISALSKNEDSDALNVRAYHVSYQLTHNLCRPTAGLRYAAAQDMMDALFGRPGLTSMLIIPQLDGLFLFQSNIVLASPVQHEHLQPLSVRAVLGGSEGSLVDLYGGELEFDNWTVNLWESRGRNTGKVIRYGKDLAALSFDTDTSGLETAYLGWWRDQNGSFYTDAYVAKSNVSDFASAYVVAVDLSGDLEAPEGANKPTDAQMEAATQAYANGQFRNHLKTSITIDVLPESLQDVYLCDTVIVEHPGYGLQQEAKIVRTRFNPITEKYTSVTIGEIKKSITDTIAGMLRQGG